MHKSCIDIEGFLFRMMKMINWFFLFNGTFICISTSIWNLFSPFTLNSTLPHVTRKILISWLEVEMMIRIFNKNFLIMFPLSRLLLPKCYICCDMFHHHFILLSYVMCVCRGSWCDWYKSPFNMLFFFSDITLYLMYEKFKDIFEWKDRATQQKKKSELKSTLFEKSTLLCTGRMRDS